MEALKVITKSRTDLRDITSEVSRAIANSGLREGACLVFVSHTTAGITINENADPAVREDIGNVLDRLIPQRGDYRHLEGNTAAHVKASLVGNQVIVPVRDSRLVLGTWQGIFLCEFDGPRERTVYVVPIKAATQA